MFRSSDAPRCILPALAVVFVLLAMTVLAPPLAAQERGAAAAAEDDDKTVEVDDEEDDLLEPSNTGYIDDAVVGSKIRIRYDSATGATKPDRAEFIYGKCLCFEAAFGQDAASPGPAANLDLQEFELAYERAFSKRFSLFFEVPFRAVDLDVGAPVAPVPPVDTSGLGDVRAGMKYALIAESDRYLTFQLRGYFASGDAEKALGTDHATIEPGLLYFSRPSERLTLASEFRWWHPLAGSSDPVSLASGGVRAEMPIGTDPRVRNDDYAGDILRFGFGASYEGAGSKVSFSPVAELVGWYVLDGWFFPAGGPLPLEADNDTIVNLKLGARISGSSPGSFYLGYGFPLSHEEWYDGILRFEYRLPLAAPKRYKEKMAISRAAQEKEAADRAALARAAAEAQTQRQAAEKAAREAEAQRLAAEKAAREAEARKAEMEKQAREAEQRRAQADAAAEAKAARRVALKVNPCLNLRPEPSLSVSRLDCLKPGTGVKVRDQKDKWSHVELGDGRQGWVVSRYLEPMGS